MILAIDQGTTGSTALVVSERAEILGRGYAPALSRYPRPGWVEQDAMQLLTSVHRAADAALADSGRPAIRSIGITNQRETAVAWSARTGRPLTPAIVWQCRRTSERCAELEAAGHAPTVRRLTGLVVDPYFSATKFGWMLHNVPDVATANGAGDLRFGTVDAWLIWNLTGGAHVTDASNGSRTALMDIGTATWSPELADLFDVPLDALPEIVDSSQCVGGTCASGPWATGIPICGIAGDQQAALFGHLAAASGDIKVTYGTGCFLLQNVGGRRPTDVPGLLSTIAWRLRGVVTYALEGSIFVGGDLIAWLVDELGLIGSAEESEALARGVADSAGAVIVPAFAGLGAPHWDSTARGVILGLTRGVTRAHLCRAALEAIGHQVADVLELMPSSYAPLRVDGGAAGNDLLLELQATIADRPVHRPAQLETTALGAAYLAGLGTGIWSSVDELRCLCSGEQVFAPDPAMRSMSRDIWQRALGRAAGWNVGP